MDSIGISLSFKVCKPLCIVYYLLYNCIFSAKYGTPNGRIEKVFSWIPRLRELGLWNYQLSFSTCFSFEESISDSPSLPMTTKKNQ